jgi:programmed cell death 6-interacting protein
MFERAALIFNLAALYSQLAEHENRSYVDGIKQAINSYQVRVLPNTIRDRGHSCWLALYQLAAGTLSFLRTQVLPKLAYSPEDEEIPLDLSSAFVQGLEWLMLAQAQECVWQKAKLGV